MSGWVLGAMAVAAAASSAYNANQQAHDQKHANDVAQKNAEKAATQQDEAINAANKKSADTSAILSAAQQAGKSGVSSTMLTGSSGVDTSSLSLGKSTLLGS